VRLRLRYMICFACGLLLASQTACRSPGDHRRRIDKTAETIINEQLSNLDSDAVPFNIERPSDILRRRLLAKQNLPNAGGPSLGSDRLEPVEHWPEEGYPAAHASLDPIKLLEQADGKLIMSLTEALQVGAQNSFEYQSLKEDVFRAALDLDLERNEFRNIFLGSLEGLASSDTTGDRAVSGVETGTSAGLRRTLENGTEISTAIAVDLARLLTEPAASSLGITADATINIPLLRGSGRHIVTEPLKQAERNVIYAIYTLERFKKTFAVDVADGYFGVLRQLDQVANNEENYRGLMESARRARRRADAGRLTEIQVDQAVQDELRARNRWITAMEAYKRSMDSFKSLLGLPPDAMIELDAADLKRLADRADEMLAEGPGPAPAADGPVPPGHEGAGRFELAEADAIRLALDNRVDFMVAQERVVDAQRKVVVAADALGPEFTLFGSAAHGSGRSVSSATAEDARLRLDKGYHAAILTLDLPIERTAERNAYRDSFIVLERAVRNVQILEDRIKLDVRNTLRNMLEFRQAVRIQAEAVKVARKRVQSAELFLEAGRAQIRDLLEARESLLAAQNSLTSALISYRLAELALQRDMGLLRIRANGLWEEYIPGDTQDDS